MHRFALISLVMVGSLACDEGEPDLDLDAAPFVDGIARDTEGGAFRVTLDSRDDLLEVGDNSLVVHVGFHHPDDPLDPGLGIPGARVSLEAWMPLDAGEHVIVASELGEGRYAIDPLPLDRPGTWQIDMRIEVGQTLRETVSFAFVVE
jgi:hypothetical protein